MKFLILVIPFHQTTASLYCQINPNLINQNGQVPQIGLNRTQEVALVSKSIGNDGIEIDFTKLGNIVNIKGNNRDQGPGASNGSGKSTLIEVIVYSIFGELIKNLNEVRRRDRVSIHLKNMPPDFISL